MLRALKTMFSSPPPQAGEAYIALLVAARNPFFFHTLSVPDTLDGRFELIVLHLALLQHRLKSITGSELFARGVVEAFFDDMERAIRELGVLYPEKRIKRMADAYHGRLHSYTQAMGDRELLKAALARNLYGTVAEGDVGLLDKAADWVERLSGWLRATPDDMLLSGAYTWPDAALLG